MNATGVSASHRIPNLVGATRASAMCQKVKGRLNIGGRYTRTQASIDSCGQIACGRLSRKKRKQKETQQHTSHFVTGLDVNHNSRKHRQRIPNQLQCKIETFSFSWISNFRF
jgi:hypothetical protein